MTNLSSTQAIQATSDAAPAERQQAHPVKRSTRLRWLATDLVINLLLATSGTLAQGFDKVNTTVTNVNAILVTIAVAVVTIAIMWAGFKMIFQAARLADVAHILLGGTLIGGASAFASYIVS